MASLAKLLELLAPVGRPLSELVAELPEPTLIHRRLACPWAKKGLVMRVLNERLAGRDLDLTDGIKLLDERGWSQVLPDPDEPLVHLYAEGETLRGLGGARARGARARGGDHAGRRRRTANLGRSLKLRLTPRYACCFTDSDLHRKRWYRKGAMEPLPDLATLSDEDLKALIEKLELEENEVSFRRRLLQGRIDILRAERIARLKGRASPTSTWRS